MIDTWGGKEVGTVCIYPEQSFTDWLVENGHAAYYPPLDENGEQNVLVEFPGTE